MEPRGDLTYPVSLVSVDTSMAAGASDGGADAVLLHGIGTAILLNLSIPLKGLVGCSAT